MHVDSEDLVALLKPVCKHYILFFQVLSLILHFKSLLERLINGKLDLGSRVS
jgi:hypothetical protein